MLPDAAIPEPADTKARITARAVAATFVELIDEQATDGGPVFAQRLWELLRDEGIKRVPRPPAGKPEVTPMGDREAQAFAELPLAFPKWRGCPIRTVEREDPDYLHWLVIARFIADLNRYLARTKREDMDHG